MIISSWRRRRAARRAAKDQNSGHNGGPELITIPKHFLCPISLELMKDPVTLSTGTTYDRDSIETWIEAGNATCPVTNQVLRSLEPIPNHAIRKIIQQWCVENRSHGVERIPTPRIPITSYEVLEIFARIRDAAQRGDGGRCSELVAKIKESAKESDRNKRCIVSYGAGGVLSAAFESFSRKGYNGDEHVLGEVLSVLMMLTPALDEEASRNLSLPLSLQKIVWFLRFGNLSGRRNAVLALKSVLSFDHDKAEEVGKIEGALEALMKLIKEPICPTTTKASLLAMYYLVKKPDQPHSKAIAMSLTEMGLLQKLLEMLVDSERSTCEKALGVLDGICSHDEVREKGRENGLMIPVLAKKLLRVSDMATEFSASILLKIVKKEGDEEREAVEALGAGAFQKLLLVLQIGSNEVTKEKVTELLKILNVYRNKVECVDSLDFKHLRRPF